MRGKQSRGGRKGEGGGKKGRECGKAGDRGKENICDKGLSGET